MLLDAFSETQYEWSNWDVHSDRDLKSLIEKETERMKLSLNDCTLVFFLDLEILRSSHKPSFQSHFLVICKLSVSSADQHEESLDPELLNRNYYITDYDKADNA